MKRYLMDAAMVVLMSGIISGCVAYTDAYVPEPPAARVEVIGVAPYAQAVWVPGYWSWHRRHREYVWVPGGWDRGRRGRGFEHRR